VETSTVVYTSALLAANRSVTLFLALGLINEVVDRLAIIIFNFGVRVVCDIAAIIRVEVNGRGAIMTIVKRSEVGLCRGKTIVTLGCVIVC